MIAAPQINPSGLDAPCTSQAGAQELFRLDFRLPPELEAAQPPEARGLRRDQVRLMVSYRRSDKIVHSRFDRLADFLAPGDLLVINTSATRPAALNAVRENGEPVELHVSTPLPGGFWSVELRRPGDSGTKPFYSALPGEKLALPSGGSAQLLAPYRPGVYMRVSGPSKTEHTRLWRAKLVLPEPVDPYLAKHGFPIRYGYVKEAWPLADYQTVYADEPGSAEMPSAGRAFTQELIDQLETEGIGIAPLVLHTGVASLEDHEPPYPEYYCVPAGTARAVNAARAAGRRVVAVGTTSVRALESTSDYSGQAHPAEGYTNLIVTPQRGVRLVDGLLTGLHEPRSSHLAMLAAFTGCARLQEAYRAALTEGYLWHEFGDLHLILP